MKLQWDVQSIHLRHPFVLSDSRVTERQVVILHIEDGGIEGLGEAAPSTYFGESCESVVGVFRRTSNWIQEHAAAESLHTVDAFFARDYPDAPSARSGMVMAVADWKAKMLGIPLWKLLAVEPPPSRRTSFTIGIDTPDKLRIKLEEAAGFPVLKIKMGRGDQDYEILETIRSITDKPLRVDANEGWTFDEAMDKLNWLAKHNVEMVEQPLAKETVERMPQLLAQSPLPVFGDENIRLFNDIEQWGTCFNGVNVKLDKCGGILEAVRMLKQARSLGLQTMLGCMVQTSVGIAAAAHLGALADLLDLDGHLLIRDDPYQGIEIDRGLLTVSDRPGLGLLPS